MLVTVLMSVFNSEEYLKAAIDSILSQTFKDFEFIILDDGSTDGSIKIIQDYASIDQRIVLIQNDTNLGLAASLNKGILAAKGRYIARQDADDLSAPTRLAKQIEFATKNPELDVIGANCYVIDIAGDIVFENSSFSSLNKNELSQILLRRQAIFAHGTAFIKKEKLIEVGLYDDRFYFVQDAELWLRMLKNGAKFNTLNDTLYSYRKAPVANPKRKKTKEEFNKVLQMIYVDCESAETVDLELKKIMSKLNSLPKSAYSYYMSAYWQSLANASYLNNGKAKNSYSYLYKAIRERNQISNYAKYLGLGLMYMFPKSLTLSLLKHTK